MAFDSIARLIKTADEKPLWQAVRDEDCRDRGADAADSYARMSALWRAMAAAVAEYNPEDKSLSGLVGGDGAAMARARNTLCGDFMQEVIATALKTGECNACMKRIVAAPTAGASGVMPAVLLPLQRREALPDEEMIRALYVAAGFGQVIAARASISGAEGGCQAEVGSAAGMAAAALTFLRGGTPAQMAHACSTALQNLMGLVCDPVAGLVEVPCVKRNVIGAAAALTAADMALAGIVHPIATDEVIDAMRAVGDVMPAALRETGAGGLAATPTGRAIAEQFCSQ